MSSKMITLISSDNQSFQVEESIIIQSQTIKSLIEDECAEDGIPLLNVTGSTLAKVIEYCKKHVVEGEDEDLKNWDAEFMKLDRDALFEVMMAANYLNVKELLALACRTAAENIQGKTPPQIREYFGIKNDWSPEEEEQLMIDNAWAYEEAKQEKQESIKGKSVALAYEEEKQESIKGKSVMVSNLD